MDPGRKVRISGLVQGVCFRAWTRKQARQLGIRGWVRNCDDGSVEALVVGDPHALDELVEMLREGPPGARVASVETQHAEPEKLGGFEIRA